MTMLTSERLRECLHYDADTGVFTWLVKASKNTVIGSVAGCFTAGYPVRIRVDGKCYRAHRLAWLYVHGQWPKNVVDHRNGANQVNVFANLRDVPTIINAQNMRRPHSDNKSGFLGVSPRNGGFVAQIYANGKAHYLGKYTTPEIAHAVYVAAKRQLHEGNTL